MTGAPPRRGAGPGEASWDYNQGRWTKDASGLPRQVLEDFYHRNGERLFGLAPLALALIDTPEERLLGSTILSS